MTAGNPFAYPGAITIDTLGELFAHHSRNLGGWTMEDPPADPPPATPPGEKAFTQADVDRIVKQRADRVAADRFSDYSDLQAKAKRLEEIEAANATELEKAVKKAKAEGASEVQSAANARLLTAEARALAAEAKFRNPTLAVKAIDLSGVKVADDGTVDGAAVKALLADLAKDEPYLVDDGKGAKPKPDGAQGQRQGKPSRFEEGRAEARRRFGNPAEQQ